MQYNGYMMQGQQPMQQQQKPVQVAPPEQVSNQGIGISFGGLTNGVNLPVIRDAAEVVTTTPKKKAKKKSMDAESDEKKMTHSEVVDATIYADTYQDTNVLLKQTIAQLDTIASDFKQELDSVRSSRTIRGKYMAIGNLAKPLGDALATKVQAIKELNNSIKAVNDFEYKRAKDNRAFESQSGDDKAIMDLYNAFIQSPAPNKYSSLGPNTNDVMFGAIATADGNNIYTSPNGQIIYDQVSADPGYDAYIQNISPEQNAMLLDADPNIETVVVYDKATGAKQFRMMNTMTGEFIPNASVPDPMFLDDVTVDTRRGVARNTNLNTVYKVVVTSADKVNEY